MSAGHSGQHIAYGMLRYVPSVTVVSRFSNTVACRTGSYSTNGKTRAEGTAGTRGGARAKGRAGTKGGAARKARPAKKARAGGTA